MTAPQRIVIASRASALAMWQAEHVRERLRQLHDACEVSILSMTTRGDRILDRSLACLLNRPAYGGFPVFLEVPPQAGECPRDANQPATFAVPEPGVDLEPGAVRLESVEGDARPEVVTVDLVVDVAVAGTYEVYGALAGGRDGEEPVAGRPGYPVQTVFSTARISGLPGAYPVLQWLAQERGLAYAPESSLGAADALQK